jgi:hypothetical protein
VSYSMLEPESEPVCECRYDPVHDRMDREDCFLHCDTKEEASMTVEYQPPVEQTPPKKPAAVVNRDEENAA